MTWPLAIVQVSAALAVAALGWHGVIAPGVCVAFYVALAGLHTPQLQRR